MTSPFHSFLTGSPRFQKKDHQLFYQIGFAPAPEFERNYLALRTAEGRFYEDQIVAQLPSISRNHPLAGEWKIRKHAADRLIQYLKKKNVGTILEIGSGNGWLIHYLHQALHVPCCGVDINETELKQASGIFVKSKCLDFVYADILSDAMEGMQADIIILASCIQYFPDLNRLLKRLLKLVSEAGEIHVLDSPVYNVDHVAQAKGRTLTYFEKMGMSALKFQYHHHTWDIFQGFDVDLLHNPESILNKVKAKLSNGSPFPWIKIKNR